MNSCNNEMHNTDIAMYHNTNWKIQLCGTGKVTNHAGNISICTA